MGHHHQLLRAAALQLPLVRQYLDALHHRSVGRTVLRSLLDPAPHHADKRRAAIEPFTAAMGHGSNRLAEQQAEFRRGRRHTSAAGFVDQVLEILARLEAEQRQLEAVLTAGLAVTGARVAAKLGEDRHDLVLEADRSILDQSGDRHFHAGGAAVGCRGLDDRLAFLARRDQAQGVDGDQIDRSRFILDLPGQIGTWPLL